MDEGPALAHRVIVSLYRDSVALMVTSAELQAMDGVVSASAVMATAANRGVLAQSGLLPADLDAAPDDLLIVVTAVDIPTAEMCLAFGVELLAQEAVASEGIHRETRAATVDEGLEAFAGANLVSVSVAGAFAPLIMKQALLRDRHVFCFSDNVSIADEVALKAMAIERGLLLMGPDCGTALIDGTPLGFVNAVQSGPVGIVSASGTGAQEVMCQLDARGVGISQVIGVGGRDLSADVGGVMTHAALDLLAADEATSCIVLIGKPPGAGVADALYARLSGLGIPVVTCLIGDADRSTEGSVEMCATLDETARRAAIACGGDGGGGQADLPLDVGAPSAAGILGLFTGGTLASEARHLLAGRHAPARILDLGDDEFTIGRPHPMIDPAHRSAAVRAAADDPWVGILLVDLVLGHGAMQDPATPLAAAVTAATAAAHSAGRQLTVVGSVCGTAQDPQGVEAQRRILADAGILLAPSNAAAAAWAATLSEAVA